LGGPGAHTGINLQRGLQDQQRALKREPAEGALEQGSGSELGDA
jgi:hypothetical protein